MRWLIRPTAIGLLTYAVSSLALYAILPFMLAPVWDGWLQWFPILIVAGAPLIAGHITGRLSERSRLVLGFAVGSLGVAITFAVITASGAIWMLLSIALAGGILGAVGSVLAPNSKQ